MYFWLVQIVACDCGEILPSQEEVAKRQGLESPKHTLLPALTSAAAGSHRECRNTLVEMKRTWPPWWLLSSQPAKLTKNYHPLTYKRSSKKIAYL